MGRLSKTNVCEMHFVKLRKTFQRKLRQSFEWMHKITFEYKFGRSLKNAKLSQRDKKCKKKNFFCHQIKFDILKGVLFLIVFKAQIRNKNHYSHIVLSL
jgi:hypothetical protein